jgi:CheY-like chemotaxis protein
MCPRILVVDDEPDFLQLVQFNLAQQGFEVSCATNGMQALRKARSDLPDAVVLDLMLPDIDGFSVCEILQAQPSTRDIPVVALTALDEQTAQARNSRVQFTRLFTKGIDLHSLGECVRKVCEENSSRVQTRIALEGLPVVKPVD